MSLSTGGPLRSLSGSAFPSRGFSIADCLDQTMSRKEFLQMGAGLILALFGVQNLIATFQKHAYKDTAPSSLLTPNGEGFGTRKFGK